MSGDLTTLANVKTLIQITDSSQDALISLLITSVSAQIESYCGRSFGWADYDEILTSNDRQILQCENWPINSITFVKQRGNTLVQGQDYQVYPRYLNSGQVYRGAGWTGASWVRGLTADPYTGEYIYEVSYMAGYLLPGQTPPVLPLVSPSLPADIQLCAMQMVAKVYALSNSGNLGENLNSIKEGGLAYSWDNPAKIPSDLFQVIAGMPVQFAQLLNPYKRWALA